MSSSLITFRESLRTDAGETRFHFGMACAIVAIAVFSFVGCRLAQVELSDLTGQILAIVLVIAAFQALPVYLHSHGKMALRDSTLTLLWAALLWAVLPFPVEIAARLSRNVPLRDPLLFRLDSMVGANVGAIVHLVAHTAVGKAFNIAYVLLAPMLLVAFFVLGFSGKVREAKGFLIANLAAFVIGLPLFALCPAVGPWTTEPFAPRPDEMICQSEVEQLRTAGTYIHHGAGIVCFPSFHVMWAILCAWALFPFRWLRIPAIILASAIVISTLTTGWHYLVDVVAGAMLAVASIGIAKWLSPDRRASHHG